MATNQIFNSKQKSLTSEKSHIYKYIYTHTHINITKPLTSLIQNKFLHLIFLHAFFQFFIFLLLLIHIQLFFSF